MKETIYTIPINEAFEQQDGRCPMCRLAAKLEQDALEYVMGAAMMEPDVRIETNRLGFCVGHLDDMLRMGKRLPLALMLESHLIEQHESLKSAKKNPADSCFVCQRRDGFAAAYHRNLYYIWDNDPAFQEKLVASKLCYPHLGALLTDAPCHLKRKPAERLRQTLLELADKQFEALTPKVSAFCRSFDHRFADQPLGDAKTAIEQAVSWLTGVPHE